MSKFLKAISLAMIPAIILASTGLLYMWRDQAVQNEKLVAGFNRIEVMMISNREVLELKFDLLKKDIKGLNSNVIEHEEEDRRLIGMLFEKLNSN